MVERREIELIPKELEEKREREKHLRTSRFIGFGFLGLSVLILILLLSLVGAQTMLLNNLRRQISEKEARIDELLAIEERVVALTDKNDALIQILSERSHYSVLFKALKKSIPTGVEIKGVSASETQATVGLSGETQSYIDLAKLLENLIDPEMGGSVFTQVALTSVSFNPTKGKAQFVAEATAAKTSLKKGWEVLLK